MTESTKELFNAPWYPFSRACDFHGIKNSKGVELFSDASLKSDVRRIARLPELYNALMEAARNQCCHCLDYEIVPMNEDLIEECPKHIENCFCRQWWKLLKKVRDGE